MLRKFCPKDSKLPVKFAQIGGAYFEPCFSVERKDGEIKSFKKCDEMITDDKGCWCKMLEESERIFSDWLEIDGRIYRITIDTDGAIHQTGL